MIVDIKKDWVRYWCCDKSGHGKGKWKYLHTPSHKNDIDEVRDTIIEVFENWMMFADSYSLEIECGVIPPVKEIEELILQKENQIQQTLNDVRHLKSSLLQIRS